jgi:hypothetical protein
MCAVGLGEAADVAAVVRVPDRVVDVAGRERGVVVAVAVVDPEQPASLGSAAKPPSRFAA